MRTIFMIICMIIIVIIPQNLGVRITHLRVPGGASHEAPLDCRYDLENDQLYDVKWYKDGQQFFRCLPSGEIFEYKVEGVKVYHLGHPVIGSCPVLLTALNSKSEGEYKCEVSAEGPFFSTAIKAAKLRFIRPSRKQNQTMMGNEVNTTWNAYSSKGSTCLTTHLFIDVLKFAYLLFLFAIMYTLL